MDEKVYPTISKSSNDPNLYRHISLNNGIKAFLISSPKTTPNVVAENLLEKKTQKSAFHHFKEYSKVNQAEQKAKHKIDKKTASNEFIEGSDQENEIEDFPDVIKSFLEKKEMEEPESRTSPKDENKGISSVVILVETGSGNEPKEFHGLAHLLEHVIFLGCEEFPDQESFSQFISNNGGSDNGQTTLDYTLFNFNIENDHLSEAIYRFSRLLKNPLFPEDGIVKELKAVNNEFELALSSDGSRNFQILCSSSHPDSKYNSFSWGSLSSLNYESSVLRNQILKYFKEFYTTERIKLCIFSKLDLDTLESYVEESFGDMEKSSTPIFSNLKKDSLISKQKISNDELYRSCYNGMYYVETVKNEHLLFLSWPLKPFFHHHRCRSIAPIVNLINEEGPNSLSTLLKKGNLINSLCAYSEDCDGLNSLFFLFTVEFDLTEQGVEKWCDIVSEIFNYFNLIKEQPEVPSYYLSQLKILAEMNYLYADEEPPSCMIEKLVFLMTFVDPKELILVYSGLFLDWKNEYYQEILEQLSLKDARITLMSKNDFFPKRITLSLVEKWFGTKYFKEDLNDFVVPYLKNLPHFVYKYKLPEENPYLPTKLEVLKPKSNDKFPKVIYSNHEEKDHESQSSPKIKFWHFFDLQELKPKVCMEIIVLYRSFTESIENEVNVEFFIEYFMEKFNDSIGHQSFEAEICFEASLFEEKGINFSVYGYFDKIQVFIEKTFNFFLKICNDPIDESVFYQIKNRTLKDLKNYILDSESQLQESMNNFLFPDFFLPEQYEEFLKNYNLKEFQEFCSYNMRSFENLFSITSYFHGNIYEETASEIFHSILNCFKENLQNKKNLTKGLSTKDFLCKKVLTLPPKTNDWSRIVVSQARNETNNNLLIIKYIDFGKYDLLERNKLSVLMNILSPQAHEFLRRKRQIGYLANASLSDVRNRLGVCIIVNSSEKNLEEISQEMENFVIYFLDDYLETHLMESEYNQIVNGLIAEKLEIIRDMKLNCGRFWGEIILNELLFDRSQKNVEILKKLGFKEMKTWIREKMSNNKNSFILGVVPKDAKFPKENELWELLKDKRQEYFKTFEMDLFHYEFY